MPPSSSSFDINHSVGELKDHQGYKHIIQLLQIELDGLESKLEASEASQVDISLLAQWKCHRKLLRRLRNLPIEYSKLASAQLTGV